jgi:hypothetical protein
MVAARTVRCLNLRKINSGRPGCANDPGMAARMILTATLIPVLLAQGPWPVVSARHAMPRYKFPTREMDDIIACILEVGGP